MSKPSRVRRSRAACWLAASALSLMACADDVTLATDEADIVGGELTAQRPEIGDLLLDGRHHCTGTLISPRHVITAVHCVDSPGAYSFAITSVLGATTAHPVSAIHPFSRDAFIKVLSGHTADVALLTLTQPVSGIVGLRPAAIASVRPVAPERVTSVGYGCTDRQTHTGGGDKRYRTYTWGEPSEILCPGDSGGPALLGDLDERGPIWGVHHAILDNTEDGFGDFYADVVAFREQIELLTSTFDGIQTGFTRNGRDTAVVTRESADACRQTCIGNTGCRAYVFDHRDRSCHIKDAAHDALPSSSFSTGVAPIFEVGFDRPGGDLTDLSVGRVEECAAACAGNAACRAFTYHVDGQYCWLKSTVTPAVLREGLVSGLPERHRERNYDRPGHDLRTLTGVADAATCARRCAGEAKCAAFTYKASNQRCWLKHGAPWPTVETGLESGVKRGLEVDSDRPGGDYRRFGSAIGQPEVCMAACANEARCKAWTFRQSDGDEATCFLKDRVTGPTYRADMVSGVKGLEMYR
jgi:hypothetical protein